MSINSAMLAGVSGLVANSSALAAISDNIANVNTVAYKRNQVNFANVVTAQSVQGRYSAGGVQGVTRQYVSQQGLVQSANSPTDLAINGDGFFVATTKGAGLTPADARVFTRSGSFSVDASGYLVNDAKLYLQGWPVQANGGYNVNPSDLSLMQPINVKSLGTAVAATENVAINATLDNRTTAGPQAATWDPTVPATSMADYLNNTTATPTGVTPDFTIPMSVVDSVGGTHKLSIAFLKAAAPNTWHAEIIGSPTDITNDNASPATLPAGVIASGDVVFDNTGNLDLANAGTTLFGGSLTPQINLGASGDPATPVPRWADALGIKDQVIDLKLANLQQIASPSALNSINADGASAGNVIAVQVDNNGIVSAIFDNSQVRQIAKIGLATFPNPDGLRSTSGNAYTTAIPAGVMVVKEPGVGGAGKISPSSLEASTVDLSAEFTGLITTQKAYSASSKIITTADQMLEELINIKR